MPRISDLRPALIDFSGLELRQVLALHELASKFLGVFGLRLGRDEILQLAGRDDARVSKLFDELFEGNGHNATQPVKIELRL